MLQLRRVCQVPTGLCRSRAAGTFIGLILAADLALSPLAAADVTRIIGPTGDTGVTPGLMSALGVTTDAAGNVFVTGFYSDNAFKVTPGGVITEIIDATGDGAGNTLDRPGAVAADAAGNVFILGTESNNVFKVTPGGVITEIIDGSGDGSGNTLDGATALATDSSGNVFVAGLGSDNVFKITPGGTISQIIDATGDGAGNPLDGPSAVATDGGGNVFVTGVSSNNAFEITPAGVVIEIIDATGDGAGNALNGPRAIATDASGNVFVGGEAGGLFYPDGNMAFQIVAGGGFIASAFPNPPGVWTRVSRLATDFAGNAYVGSQELVPFVGLGSSVSVISPAGAVTLVDTVNSIGRGLGFDLMPYVATDNAGNLFVAGGDGHNVRRFTPSGVETEIVDSALGVPGNFLGAPTTIATDSAGNVFVAGRFSSHVFQVTPGGVISTIIDSTGDGAGSMLGRVSALASDDSGNAFIASGDLGAPLLCLSVHGSDNVFEVTPGGVISEIIDATGDGAGNELSAPTALATDATGNVFVAGGCSNNVFRVTPGGVISEIIDATGDGAGNSLDGPIAVATNSSGDVFVAGFLSRNIFRITPGGVITEIVDLGVLVAGFPILGMAADGGGDLLVIAGETDVFGVGGGFLVRITPDNPFPVTNATTVGSVLLGIAADSAGNAFITDFWDPPLRVSPQGASTTIFAEFGFPNDDDVREPWGVAVDKSGNLFFADHEADSVFKVTDASVRNCPDLPAPGCLSVQRAKILYKEKTAGKEKMTLQWKKIDVPTTQAEFGDPWSGATHVTACIYDDSGSLVEDLFVSRAGDVCGEKPCWKKKGTKGYTYKDKFLAAEGISKIGYTSGDPLKGKADAKGKNNAAKGYTNLPTGVVAGLAGSNTATIQMLTSSGFCVTATMNEVKKDDGLQYKAQLK